MMFFGFSYNYFSGNIPSTQFPASYYPIFQSKNLGIKELEIGYPSVAWQNLFLWQKEILTTALPTQRDINKEKNVYEYSRTFSLRYIVNIV